MEGVADVDDEEMDDEALAMQLQAAFVEEDEEDAGSDPYNDFPEDW